MIEKKRMADLGLATPNYESLATFRQRIFFAIDQGYPVSMQVGDC